MKRLIGLTILLTASVAWTGCDDHGHRHVAQSHHDREVYIYHESDRPRYRRVPSNEYREHHYSRGHRISSRHESSRRGERHESDHRNRDRHESHHDSDDHHGSGHDDGDHHSRRGHGGSHH